RFIFFVPLPASQDVLTFLMVASVFMGSGIAVANHKQIALEFFVHALPHKIRNKFMVVADGISIFFLIIIITQAYELIGKTQHTLVGAAQIPQMYYYLLVLFGCVIMAVNYINQILIKVTGEQMKEEE
ncbi:MAG: TRAP transporter small permease, partial [Tissierellales bacterium]|nr:TRAP transporter small permease [Tissierellales bacterium]